MICLKCNHYTHPDSEMARVQDSNDCPCSCHPWNQPEEDDRETIAEGDYRYYRPPGAVDR